jgi:lysozyme
VSHPLALRFAAVATAAVLASPLVVDYEALIKRTYPDPAPGGPVTGCVGATRDANGQPFRLGRTFTDHECLELLARDLIAHGVQVDRCITREIPNEVRAAVTSFAFNVGVGAACGSTLMRKLNAGDLRGACNELDRWVFAGGQRLRGLERRRAAEKAMCLRGVA